MKVTRFDAALTYVLAALGLWISYTALADLALRAGLGVNQAYAWPLVVDGLILAATRAVVTFGGHDARRYAWVLLGCAAAASIAGNMAHALLPEGPVHPAIAAIVAVVPPIAALAMTHLAVVRARVRQDVEQTEELDASPQVDAAPLPDACDPGDAIHNSSLLVAPADDASDSPMLAQLVAVTAPTDAAKARRDVDARQRVLDLLAEGKLSGRAIAQEVGVSESTVRRWKPIKDSAAA
ncbi:DUF2637 domain-containing protein [Rhodococcus sp. IEGM 1409]|uniref:DUF2637 domain-containing protein n=1 Tax=Rhodococcus sp. IEGM 1409 TaxID=3047082 RepID=UPI0024B7BB6E|nr:DUF2637 domain-containing protein [Rhodococcus sp. IEGM 1409]MDI9903820.1 DUF2637 domain-containing protein [Rhodococcus sp. IEGM 1409]